MTATTRPVPTSTPPTAAPPSPIAPAGRGGRSVDDGSATVMMLVLMFAFLAGALIWLSTTVDGTIHKRSEATAIAFQAARAGAQQLDLAGTRSSGVVTIDPVAAAQAVQTAAASLLEANSETGTVTSVHLTGATVTVTVTITTTGRPATGTASVAAQPGFDSANQ